MAFLKSIKLSGFLSFPPDAEAIPLTPLNVIIGPNGSGKSNLIEAIDVLGSTPTSLASVIRQGGSAAEWIWKGEPTADRCVIDATLSDTPWNRDLRYRLEFTASMQRLEVIDEVIEDAEKSRSDADDVYFYYRFQNGSPAINTCLPSTTTTSTTTTAALPSVSGRRTQNLRSLQRTQLLPDQSVLLQKRDEELYPELFWLGRQFELIQSFRDWTFGRAAPLRLPQRTDLDPVVLSSNSENLCLVLNELQHSGAAEEFNRQMNVFLPRYRRFSTRIHGNTAQFYLHEDGLGTPVPATRLSDGTIRFLAILALLLSPNPPPLLCIDEPEMGLHPDAVSRLGDLLVDASDRMQLIVTTHSDTLVSALTEHANSVLVAENLNGTRIERVDPQRLEQWLSKYRLGEIWRIGEIGGNP